MPLVAGTGSTDFSGWVNPAYEQWFFYCFYTFLLQVNYILINEYS